LRLEQAQEQLETLTQRIEHHHDVVRQLGRCYDPSRFSDPEADEHEKSASTVEIFSSDDIMKSLKDQHQAMFRKLFGLKLALEVKRKKLIETETALADRNQNIAKLNQELESVRSESAIRQRHLDQHDKIAYDFQLAY
jgi:chromosome segregation ATPase